MCRATRIGGGDDQREGADSGRLDRPEFYADLAKAFLMDKDSGGEEAKMAGYYHVVVARKN